MPRVYVINNETDLEIFSSDSHAKANEFIRNNDYHVSALIESLKSA